MIRFFNKGSPGSARDDCRKRRAMKKAAIRDGWQLRMTGYFAARSARIFLALAIRTQRVKVSMAVFSSVRVG